ncbi:MAG: SDR family oxidoreductase [Acidimicrobiales bacterium]
MTELRGAHLIVTGGSEGIGLATAQEAARRGATVSLVARRRDVLDAAAGTIDGPVHTANADVTDADALGAALDDLIAAGGPCDVLLCCAGYALPGYFEELPLDQFEQHMRVNYLGAVHAIRHVTPAMRQRRRGHVLVTSSTAGLMGVFGYGAYSPTKFAVRGLAEVVRAEMVRDGVRVGIVYPPDTATPGFDRENLTKPAETAALSAAIAPITAEHMARRIVAGIERNRFQIFADPTTAVLARVGGLVGPVVRRQLDRTASRARGRA